MEDDRFQTCPFCKEKICKEAVKCRFCGEWLEQSSQTQPAADHAPAPPKFETLPTVAKDESKSIIQPAVKKEISPKTLYWISTALLTACCLVLLVGFASGHLSRLSPAKQGEAIANIIIGLFKVLFAAVVTSMFVKRKGYRLLAFSVVCVICTAIGAYYFFEARQKAGQEAEISSKKFASNIGDLQQYIQQGAVGDVPEFKPTGNADMDALLQTTRDFYKDYLQGYRKANSDIQAQQEKNLSDDSLLTNKANLEIEIQKRITSQEIIEKFATNALSMIETYQGKCALLNISELYKTNFLNGAKKISPQYKLMFASWVKMQKSEQEFLQFLNDNFEDYKSKDGTISFASVTNRQKYNELAKNVQDAGAEVDGFQKRGMAAVEAGNAKLK